MKYSLSLLFILLLLAACGGSDEPTPTSAPAASASTRAIDPIAILNTYDFAHNGGDVDAGLALFADDAVVIVRSGTFAGQAQIRTWLEREAAVKSQTKVVGQRTLQNDTITWRSLVTRDDLTKLGITDAQADDEAVVQQGKIKSFKSTFTPETQAKLDAAQTLPTVAPAISAVRVITGTGATAEELKPTVDAYKQALGGADNGGEPGSKGTGFRTIVWDGLSDELSAPNLYAPDFFNQPTAPRARGAVLNTPGDGLMVSADSSNPTNTLPRFGNLNPAYPDIFKTFSGERLFSPVGSNIVDLEFFVPGTNIPAVVRGYGAVYTDVDTEHTAFEYFDAAGSSLGVYGTPIHDKGLSFLGVVYPEPIIHRVRIEYGTVELGADDSLTNDVAVMDDFIYGEPIAIPGAIAKVVTPVPVATSVATPTQVISPTQPLSPTAAVGAFVQVGDALNRDATSAASEAALASGATVQGNPLLPWATWAEKQGNSQQIFVSRQNGNAFEPIGASLNIHTNAVAQHPSIAFAGQERTVPWVAWNEPSPGFGNNNQIFASRFIATSGLWIAAGQDRGGNEPSLNIHTDKPASGAFLVGGALDPAQAPVPWVCWQEDSAHTNTVKVFVARAESDDTALGGFKWVPVGPYNGGTVQDHEPGVNLDPDHGDAEHCGLAFAGENNTVPWVVWAERSGGKPSRVFAARGVVDAAATGGLRWEMVPGCADVSEEAKCILNLNPTRAAEEPYITAGSVVAGEPASPWIVWTEVGPGGKHQVFVNRLDPTSRDKFLNVGGSLNADQNSNAVSPSITFAGNVPYVAWEEEQGSLTRVHVRHLASDPQTGTWVLDTPSDGLAVDKARGAYHPIIGPDGQGVAVIYRQGDPDTGASQVVVCANVTETLLLPRTAGAAAPLLQAVTCE